MTARIRQVELDGLRLIGLGRIPLCARCPRYADLVDRYMGSQAPATRLAQVPEDCAHLYCAPLVERFDSSCPPQPAVVERRAAS
jgi:hypothetical protein